MILTLADKPLYFPDLNLSGRYLSAAILRAQVTAESALGANRPLPLQQHTEVKPLNRRLQTCQLSRCPIIADPAPTIEARCGNTVDGWGRTHPASRWQLLEATQYAIELETGRLMLHSDFTEIRATYTSGFDFTQDDNPKVQEIKTAVASILLYQAGV
jgi:hypothetical protein